MDGRDESDNINTYTRQILLGEGTQLCAAGGFTRAREVLFLFEVIKKRVTMPPQKEAGKTPNPSTMVKH